MDTWREFEELLLKVQECKEDEIEKKKGLYQKLGEHVFKNTKKLFPREDIQNSVTMSMILEERLHYISKNEAKCFMSHFNDTSYIQLRNGDFFIGRPIEPGSSIYEGFCYKDDYQYYEARYDEIIETTVKLHNEAVMKPLLEKVMHSIQEERIDTVEENEPSNVYKKMMKEIVKMKEEQNRQSLLALELHKIRDELENKITKKNVYEVSDEDIQVIRGIVKIVDIMTERTMKKQLQKTQVYGIER